MAACGYIVDQTWSLSILTELWLSPAPNCALITIHYDMFRVESTFPEAASGQNYCMTTLQLGLLAITAAAPSFVTLVPATSSTDNLKWFLSSHKC